MKRKIIQITAPKYNPNSVNDLWALCDDSTVWFLRYNRDSEPEWKRIKEIPQDEPEVITKKKAYGFAIHSRYQALGVQGACYTEDGDYLGTCTSVNQGFLKMDLLKLASDYDYVFVDNANQLPEAVKKAYGVQ